MAPNLSKAQLLNYLQCPRRFWLDQYHPENEDDVDAMDEFLDAEERAEAVAHSAVFAEHAHTINARLGLRHAIEQTSSLLSPGVILLNATFEHEGISAQVHVLDWSGDAHRAISVTAAPEISQHHIEDCAVQAWTMRALALPEHEFTIGLQRAQAPGARSGPGELHAHFDMTDVSARVHEEIDRVSTIVRKARELHAALDEPQAATGPHCHKSGYPCPFLNYCEQG
jgi:hypothetical protein